MMNETFVASDPKSAYEQAVEKYGEVVLSGKTIHFDKLQESPELLLARPDEGLVYHYSNDVGFTMLNPPLNLK